MKTVNHKSLALISLATSSLLLASCDSDSNNSTDGDIAAIPITITMEASGPIGLSSAFFVTHEGNFDYFDTGSTASAALKSMTETGEITDLLTTINAESYSAYTNSPVAPGNTSETVILMVSEDNRYFTYGSMVLPSSDAFIGNNNPTTYDLYQMLEDSVDGTVTITASRLYDAGTEENDFLTSAGGELLGAPVGVVSDGVDEKGVITLSDTDFYDEYLNPGDFDVSIINPDGVDVITITITRTDLQ